MEIRLEGIGKKFGPDWIFRGVTCTFRDGSVSAILGRNGSGKSTLLQIVAGSLHPTEGRVTYTHGGEVIANDEIFRYLTLATPYLELLEDFTLEEMVRFHFRFKRFIPGFDHAAVIRQLDFPAMAHKQLAKFSSGMKQRLKLALAVLSDVPLLLLDEPAMNLDRAGTDWYLELLERYRLGRTLIICSNMKETEASFAGEVIRIEDFRQTAAGTGV